MEYIYAAMLLNEAGKPIDEAGLKKVVEATGEKADEAKVKVTVAALKDADISKIISETAIATAAPAASATPAEAPSSDAPTEKKDEKVKDDDKGVDAEEAAAGLGALFG